MIAARRWTLHLGGGAAKLEMDVWTEGSRLLRLDIPTQMLTRAARRHRERVGAARHHGAAE